MANVTVVGVQWGHEGKGKIVDWLSARADLVARFQGGHNAGHTLVIDGVSYKLSLLPSGVVRGKRSVIGNGVVVDPAALIAEMDRLAEQGVTVTPDTLILAENASLILSIHRELDGLREASAPTGSRIGTTGRGIGPAYEDKVGRRALRACDLLEPEAWGAKIERLLSHHNALRSGLGALSVEAATIERELMSVRERVVPFVGCAWALLDERRRAGDRILFEGAQGTLLDIDHGTYPFVTSSNTVAGQAAAGTGVGPSVAGRTLGIVKSYTTRVGEGPFPTELHDEAGELLGTRGREFGTVTGRKRRCGWFDAVLVRQACILGGVDGIALTKLDVLDGMDELKVCTGYELDGRRLDRLPAPSDEQARATPIYESVPGWSGTTQGARSWGDLPAEAVKYVRRIEELVGVPVWLLSTSPEREDTILVTDPFGA